MTIHTYPLNDLREHQTDEIDCHCDPRIEWIDEETGLPYALGPLVIHNSYDGRELHEPDRRRD